jgi:hypothetical protein
MACTKGMARLPGCVTGANPLAILKGGLAEAVYFRVHGPASTLHRCSLVYRRIDGQVAAVALLKDLCGAVKKVITWLIPLP